MKKVLTAIFLLFSLGAQADRDSLGQWLNTKFSKNKGQQAEKINIIDPRKPVQWERNPEWANVVKIAIHSDGSGCTGQFIAPDIILTADHCIPLVATSARIRNILGQEFYADVIDRGQRQMNELAQNWSSKLGQSWFIDNLGFDWALLKVRNKRYYSSKYFSVAEGSQPLNVSVYNAGFGQMRIINDEELPLLRGAFIAYLKSIGKQDGNEARFFDTSRHEIGFDEFLARHYINGIMIAPIFRDSAQLKIDSSCKLLGRTSSFGMPFDGNFVQSSCAVAGGNSGSALVDSSSTLVGVLARGSTPLGWNRGTIINQSVSMAARVDLFNKLLPSLETASAPCTLGKVFEDGECWIVSTEYENGRCWTVKRSANGRHTKMSSLPVGTQCQ